MEIHVSDKARTVMVWLTNAERIDMDLRARLVPLYQKYKAKKYCVAVFESGERDLYESTLDLLMYNKKRTAEIEVQREKAAAPEERPSVRAQLRAMKPAVKPVPQKAKQQEYSRQR